MTKCNDKMQWQYAMTKCNDKMQWQNAMTKCNDRIAFQKCNAKKLMTNEMPKLKYQMLN